MSKLQEKINTLVTASGILRPQEHDHLINRLDSNALTKLRDHHQALSDVHFNAQQEGQHGGEDSLDRAKHHAHLANAYNTILNSIKSHANVR